MVVRRAKPVRKPPEISSNLDSAFLASPNILASTPLEECCVANLDLLGLRRDTLTATNSIFERVNFSNCWIGALRLRDVRLIGCDLSNAELRGFEATRVEFIDCRLVGMKAFECRWQDVLVENCVARYAQFADGHARTCEFKASQLEDVDFRGADLEGAIFLHGTLERADLTGAKLKGVDLRGTKIDGITLRPQDAAGLIVSAPQAMQLARLLRLVIR